MNLSLYLLLTQPVDSRTSARTIRSPQRKTQPHPPAVHGPARTGAGRSPAPLQASPCASPFASPCASAAANSHSLSSGKLGFAARVVCNAMGFLLMFGGLLLLLQIAQVSLS
jgi:hypothetical protein